MVELELVAGLAEAVHEIEDAAELLVPAVFDLCKADVYSLLYEFGTLEALAEVHDKPHRLDGMTGVELAAVEAIDEIAIFT